LFKEEQLAKKDIADIALHEADLRGGNLSEADLSRSALRMANLRSLVRFSIYPFFMLLHKCLYLAIQKIHHPLKVFLADIFYF
jgi:hypothetical protein